jgi:hypothetical protein
LSISKITKLAPIILAVVALSLTVTTLAAITITKDVSSTGTITTSPTIGTYSDSACTNALSTISWGSVAAGTNTTQTIYVKNTGTGTMTLNLSANSWSPSNANSYITVTWDKTGSTLAAGQSTAATVTLAVSSSITGITSFSNTITITGTS